VDKGATKEGHFVKYAGKKVGQLLQSQPNRVVVTPIAWAVEVSLGLMHFCSSIGSKVEGTVPERSERIPR
jgi:hypothetical protein